MPFYQAVVISTHYPKYAPLRNLLSSTASFIRSQGGCVRSFNFHGSRQLAQNMRNAKAENKIERYGDHWTMHFDTNPPTLNVLNQRLAADPRVLRHTILKIGAKLPDVLEPPQMALKSAKY